MTRIALPSQPQILDRFNMQIGVQFCIPDRDNSQPITHQAVSPLNDVVFIMTGHCRVFEFPCAMSYSPRSSSRLSHCRFTHQGSKILVPITLEVIGVPGRQRTCTVSTGLTGCLLMPHRGGKEKGFSASYLDRPTWSRFMILIKIFKT